MTEDTPGRLRAQSSRDDYASMARLARALYAEGLNPHEVVRECYGVGFPEEFFVLAEACPMSLELMGRFTHLPWQLAVPPDHGGPTARPGPFESVERKVFARDPDLAPLFIGSNANLTHGGRVHCYSLTELGAGRTTVFGIPRDAEPHHGVARSGDSLLAVLHEHHTQYADWLDEAMRDPSHPRYEAVDEETVTEVREPVGVIEELQRRTASRHGD